MSESTVVVAPKRQRFAKETFPTYEAAKRFQANAQKAADNLVKDLCKAKVFARSNGTFDVVLYGDIAKAKEQEQKGDAILKAGVEQAKAIHGLKSKDRKKSLKK